MWSRTGLMVGGRARRGGAGLMVGGRGSRGSSTLQTLHQFRAKLLAGEEVGAVIHKICTRYKRRMALRVYSTVR